VAALLPVVDYLKANQGAKASISGFHDPSGKKARNEELALNRARSARGALERAGIARERIVMQKPQVTTGSGGAAEARRVEVAVQLP
jgi:K(+)-stimulated pyrophosphate-energized sodium pump